MPSSPIPPRPFSSQSDLASASAILSVVSNRPNEPVFLDGTKSLAAKSTQKTYLALKQPPLRPPPQVFGPTWTTLYALMGYAAYRAWSTGTASLNPTTIQLTKQGATLFTIQLGLNLIWMPLFFGLKRPIEATADITLLTGVTGYLTYVWSQVDTGAAWCLAPYLGWLSFATYLSVRQCTHLQFQAVN